MGGRREDWINDSHLMHTARATIFTPIAGETSYSMKPGDEVMHIFAESSVGTLRLPMISEAAGRNYYLSLRKTGEDITVIDAETESTLYTLDDTADHILIYCDGLHWYSVDSTLLI